MTIILKHAAIPNFIHLLSLPRNQVPEWSSSYIDYKGLKKFIKSVVVNDMQRENVDVAGKIKSTPALS